MEKGDVFRFKDSQEKYVYCGSSFEEWYNTGGMGEYTYYYINLARLLGMGEIKDSECLRGHIIKDKNQKFESEIEKCYDEVPFAFSERQATLYTVRRKVERTITIYE